MAILGKFPSWRRVLHRGTRARILPRPADLCIGTSSGADVT